MQETLKLISLTTEKCRIRDSPRHITPYKNNINSWNLNVKWMWYLNNYFRLHFCLSFRSYICHTSIFSNSCSGNPKCQDKSCLACIKGEKYVVWVTLRPLGSIRRGETELRILQYGVKWSQATYIETHFSVSAPSQSWSQAIVCVSTPRMYPRSDFS